MRGLVTLAGLALAVSTFLTDVPTLRAQAPPGEPVAAAPLESAAPEARKRTLPRPTFPGAITFAQPERATIRSGRTRRCARASRGGCTRRAGRTRRRALDLSRRPHSSRRPYLSRRPYPSRRPKLRSAGTSRSPAPPAASWRALASRRTSRRWTRSGRPIRSGSTYSRFRTATSPSAAGPTGDCSWPSRREATGGATAIGPSRPWPTRCPAAASRAGCGTGGEPSSRRSSGAWGRWCTTPREAASWRPTRRATEGSCRNGARSTSASGCRPRSAWRRRWSSRASTAGLAPPHGRSASASGCPATGTT